MPSDLQLNRTEMRALTPDEEWQFWQELYTSEAAVKALENLKDSYTTLQVRSQILLGLITICLTITGFSGIRIAADSPLARLLMLVGILGVLISAVILFLGPLQVRWLTQTRADTIPQTIVALIRRRNTRTVQYHAAVVCLLIGLTGYVLSITAFMTNVR